jgi:methylthioribose-1-phosphate isomerase
MKKSLTNWKKIFAASLFVLPAKFAHAAGTYVHINDMSQVQYQLTSDGNVYFRNLNQFNNQVTGCCYAFVLNTTTNYGKSAWSVILMKMASKASLSMYVSETNPPTSGNPAVIDHIGNW